ncbi:MAG: DarT ssDNA thymidine ADP-ribosyltransferase family protein [Bacteroidales bacterium]|nr:DarT ssDNA thymidine ADP-ribosyltransferase family protein [Bacteroidales bacterium]MCI6334483.1 DarT ssDNA thymidine ADP-ribosyltransferase family protein [Bacteroidales bacterium]
MAYKNNYDEFKKLIEQHHITTLYHFTDRENLESIIKNGGLYSWADCEQKGISISKPGGSMDSRNLDRRDNLQNFVRVSFVKEHPMMYVAMNDGRISNPVVLEIDPEVIYWQDSLYADRNATKNGALVGSSIDDFSQLHFNSFKAKKHFDLDADEQKFYQAEVLVKNHIPLQFIKNIGNFGFTIPSQSAQMQTKTAYTAQITRNTPTAFIFLIDQSVSMQKYTTLYGEEMPMAEAVARIVNHQLNELVLRCIKGSETRDYYDIAIIGYGEKAYSGWKGELEGRDFVKPSELKEHPYKKITTKKETRTRKGVKVVEIEEVQWIEAEATEGWTRVHHAFEKAKGLLDEWMEKHHDKDCYPPTIINITDGEFNGATKEYVLQQANELKSMFTNDGNVILFNIHISANKAVCVTCPASKDEVSFSSLATTMYEMSSLLPMRYSDRIADLRGDGTPNNRYTAMSINADMSTLIQLMDIGTPTNISQNK